MSVTAAALVGETVAVEVEGYGKLPVRSPAIGALDGMDSADLKSVAVYVLSSCLVDSAGEQALSPSEAEAWVESKRHEEVLDVTNRITAAVGMDVDVDDLAEWLNERPLIRAAIRISRDQGRPLADVLSMPIGEMRLAEADHRLSTIESYTNG